MERQKDYRKRVLALITAAAVFSCVLFMYVYEAHEAGHDCTGEDCVICFCMHACERIITNAKVFVAFSEILCILAITILCGRDLTDIAYGNGTPVMLKVRLNN